MQMTRAFSATLVLGLSLTLTLGSPADHARRRFVNKEFRLSVEAPSGTTTCAVASPGGGHQHGFSIFLRPRQCDALGPARYVMVVGNYNATFKSAPEKYLRMLCPHGKVLEPRTEEGLNFPGRESAACQCKASEKGWVLITVVAGAGRWPSGFGMPPSVPHVYYTAYLHTRPSELLVDLKTFRRILATVRTGPWAIPSRGDRCGGRGDCRCPLRFRVDG